MQQYLVGLDAEWEEGSTRWTVGVQIALEEDAALPFFPVEVATSPIGTGLVLESDKIVREELEQERPAPGATESHQKAGNGDTAREEQPGTPQPRF